MTQHIKTFLHTVMQPTIADWKKTVLQQWPTIIGSLYDKISIEKITDDNTLILGVHNSCWLQEVYFLSTALQEKINQVLGAPHVQQVRFKIKGVKKQKRKKQQTPYTQKNLKVTLSHHEQKALEQITDISLKDALHAFGLRCHRERS